ncbi:MAG: phosphatidylserine decarboxylase family protein [Saprospiraceae bacterium]|nr:phosphatidylserine decarboxylase family protein [Saprospiraceae bacterium]
MTFRIHKEGHFLLVTLLFLLGFLNVLLNQMAHPILFWVVLCVSLAFYGIVLQFFRNPVRTIAAASNNLVYAPADGRVCVIEEVEETECFHDRRLQISIFMSPLNVHVNRNPVSGMVAYFKYHPGKYLVAWHPKSSTENERTTFVYDTGKNKILMRQIAGALARRICWYVKEGDRVEQGADMGFIKFGSRVDLFLPIGTQVEVQMDQMVRGNETIVAKL